MSNKNEIPQKAVEYFDRGLNYSNLGKEEEAIKEYTEAIELYPKYAMAYSNRGVSYSNLGKEEEAIKDYTKAIELEPKDNFAHANRAGSYSYFGKEDEAIKGYTEAIKHSPKHALYYYKRGNAYRNLGKQKEAIEDFKKAGELDPTVFSGEIKEEIKEDIKGVQDFQTILEGMCGKHEKDEKKWLFISQWVVLFVILLLSFFIFNEKVYVMYAMYIFSSIITFTVIRQYTNAKAFRIEANNRLAMAKMFETVSKNYKEHKDIFFPKLVDAIVYSTKKEKNNYEFIEKITKLLDEKIKQLKP